MGFLTGGVCVPEVSHDFSPRYVCALREALGNDARLCPGRDITIEYNKPDMVVGLKQPTFFHRGCQI